jgi:phosphoribosylanthranilate isomerase
MQKHPIPPRQTGEAIAVRSTKVKICGITNLDDAGVAVEAGADMLGLIFYPPSPRYVTLEQARAIVASVPASLQTIGVFVNEDAETVRRIAQTSGVQMVQLHGEESPELCQQLSCPVVKTFRFTAQIQPEMMRQYTVAAYLIEGFHADFYGGGGVLADWQRVATLHQYGRIILAGGLTPENVGTAIRTVRPYAVDVCSGVEAAPGKKDWHKVRAFVARAKAAWCGTV